MRFMQNISEVRKPGSKTLTRTIMWWRFLPPKYWFLYIKKTEWGNNRAEEKPARNPMKTKRTTADVRILPRYAGERTPAAARTMTVISVQKTWTPVPTRVEKRSESRGGLKTSPWISFQPLSSTVSTRSSSVYYDRYQSLLRWSYNDWYRVRVCAEWLSLQLSNFYPLIEMIRRGKEP